MTLLAFQNGPRPSRVALAPLERVERLRKIVRSLDDSDADQAWLKRQFERYFEQAIEGLSVECALQLPSAWWLEERRRERDELLCEIAEVHFGNHQASQAAKAICAEWRRYERAGLRADRRRGRSEAPAKSLRAALFQVALRGGLPSERHTRRILNSSKKQNLA